MIHVLLNKFTKMLLILFLQPAVQIVSYTQTEKTLAVYGKYCRAEWKPDSSALAVIVSCFIFHLWTFYCQRILTMYEY